MRILKNNNPQWQQLTRLKHGNAGSNGNEVTVQWWQIMKMLASAKTINQGIGDGNITSMAMLAQQTAVS